MISTIQNLREIARRCRYGEPLPPDLSAWLGESLGKFLSHERPTADEAFGLQRARGGVPWWKEDAMRRRDAALRKLAGALCPMLPVAAQARRIRSLALRYAASAWPRERNCETLPAASEGTFREWLWIAFKSGAPMPLGERQLRHVLGVCTKPLKAGAEATSSRSTPGMIGADPRAVIGATRAAQTERRRSRSPRRTRLAAAVLCCLATAACASQEHSASARERWCGAGGGAARGALVTVAAGAVGGAYAAGAGAILGAALGVALSPVGAVIGAVDGSKNNPCPDTKSTAAQPPSEVRPESSLDGDRRDRQSE